MERYNRLNKYLKNKFGERTLKICIDAGFTCPNRDGKCGTKGCIFCGEMGAGENIKYRQGELVESIKSQVTNFLNSYRGERANKFIAYFQSFTNTYDTLESLKLRYNTALNCSDKIIGLEVATRPDCITKEIVKLLASYKEKYYVCVELGLQTANDVIGNIVNRGYKTADFINACKLLKQYDIDVVAHLMVGLPEEKEKDILDTVRIINECNCNGIKIHSTYIIKNTELNNMFKNGKYLTISLEYYVKMVGKILSHLNKNIVVHRITADPPRKIFVAPEWMLHKKIVLNSIEKYLQDNDIYQGCDLKENSF